uniref:Uncharacterized protein n=1 Tax=Opuntia streptacantha TaxID=393608 RepID=A0A7C8YJ42_OPUST
MTIRTNVCESSFKINNFISLKQTSNIIPQCPTRRCQVSLNSLRPMFAWRCSDLRQIGQTLPMLGACKRTSPDFQAKEPVIWANWADRVGSELGFQAWGVAARVSFLCLASCCCGLLLLDFLPLLWSLETHPTTIGRRHLRGLQHGFSGLGFQLVVVVAT